MTKEEIKRRLLNMERRISIRTEQDKRDFEALEMIIWALSQEPKTGYWIYDDEYSDWFDVTYECSCCKRAIIVPYEIRNEVYKNYPYCHCGAKMKSEEWTE